jgi:isopentenyl diphosphate isomerase/L-lactate dehydrogenase-like FMN-dependent dehydrogenase
VLTILADDLLRTMQLAGCRSLEDIRTTESLVVHESLPQHSSCSDRKDKKH